MGRSLIHLLPMNADMIRAAVGAAVYEQALHLLSARHLPPPVAALEPWEKVALHVWTLDTEGELPAFVVVRTGVDVSMPDDVRKRFEQATKDLEEAEAEWEAAGRPWTDDDEAFLDRMTGV
jgi:hypothetical protein